MAQTAEGAARIAAKHAGVPLDEYLRRTGAGLKWCTAHRTWHRATVFGRDASRGDGRAASCAASRRARRR